MLRYVPEGGPVLASVSLTIPAEARVASSAAQAVEMRGR